uniref:Uncharacterized protein n=1 Tax=Caenorhabditis japonica TaxID=281687 RepID=A0A8R1EBQ7_CAEJA
MEEACREVVEGLLDTLDKDVDESKHTERSISSDESVSCEEGDDAGSLITLYASSDSETEEIKCELYDENDVPAVGLELTVG